MEKEIADILRYLEEVNSFALPKYRELPGVALYMEQVLSYINGLLSSLSHDETKSLTSFMVNNYVKSGLIDEPQKKKYSKEQIGYLIAVTLMKTTVSMSEMEVLIKLDQGISPNKEKLYRFWSDVEGTMLSEAAKKTQGRIESIQRRYVQDSKNDAYIADENARNSLGLIAMRLAIQAQANKLLSDYIIKKIDESMQREEETKTQEKTSKKAQKQKKK
ncbi:MAG: DUF1836 domain-containing protein [Bacilli bacterium]|nr:DUF1836 domain-containing protein [Bacilli bacterium]